MDQLCFAADVEAAHKSANKHTVIQSKALFLSTYPGDIQQTNWLFYHCSTTCEG
jgi:hypothetical protein